MTFNDLLKKWNDGILRGSKSLFAKKIGVSSVTVSEWAKGNRPPGEMLRKKIAGELGVSVDDLMSLFRKERESPPMPNDMMLICAKMFEELSEIRRILEARDGAAGEAKKKYKEKRVSLAVLKKRTTPNKPGSIDSDGL